MKPIFFALTALGGLAAAAPALAQNYGTGYQGNNDRYYNNYTNRGTYDNDDRAYANVSVEEVPDVNMLFQTADVGIGREANWTEETMSPVVLKRIADWVLRR